MDAENDATTEAVMALARILKEGNTPEEVRIHPPYCPPPNVAVLAQKQGIAPGHLIFGMNGVPIWQGDVVRFLDAHVK